MKTNRCTGFVLMLVGAIFWLLPPGASAATKKVTYCASWVIYGRDAAIHSGLGRGIYKAEGLDVTIRRGYGSSDTFKKVGIGTCDYGNAGAGPAALGRIKGIKAKEISLTEALFQETNFFFTDSGIKTPKDIEGKRVTGGNKASSDVVMLPTFTRANGIDFNKLKIVYMSPGAKLASLGTGKVDMVVAFHSNLPAYQKLAKNLGKKLGTHLWAHYGVDLYANGLNASDETIANKKDVTMRFLRAYYKAHRWAFRNREGSMDLFMKSYPEQNRENSFIAQDLYFLHLFDQYTDKYGLGWIVREKMEKTIRLTLEASGIKEKLDPSELYTNEFMKGLPKELLFFYKQ